MKGGTEVLVSPEQEGEPGAPGATVRPGEDVTWRVSWASCPTADVCGDKVCGIDEDTALCEADCAAPRGCTGAEKYVFFDPEIREVRERREGVWVSWFATGGTFEYDRTGRDEEAANLPFTENLWTAPSEEGTFSLWVVLRDDRGGVGWERYRVRVAP